MFISEEIKNFVRNTFFFGGFVQIYDDNDNLVSIEDYKLSDEWYGDAMIDWLEDNGVIFRFDDDYYHIEDDFLSEFFSDKERAEEIAVWNANHANK